LDEWRDVHCVMEDFTRLPAGVISHITLSFPGDNKLIGYPCVINQYGLNHPYSTFLDPVPFISFVYEPFTDPLTTQRL